MVPSSEARNNISARIDFLDFPNSINYACFRRAFGFAAARGFAAGFLAGFLAAADGLAAACLATDGFRAAGLADFFAGFRAAALAGFDDGFFAGDFFGRQIRSASSSGFAGAGGGVAACFATVALRTGFFEGGVAPFFAATRALRASRASFAARFSSSLNESISSTT